MNDAELVDAATLAGVPDEFQRLWTPHRMAYIHAGADAMRAHCPFCAAPEMSDADGLIVHRGRTAYVLLNLFPYNSGHLLVCPYRHVATYDQATTEEVAEIAELPSKDALYAKVLGTMIAPITSLAVVLGQILEQKGGSLETAEAAAE